MGMHFGEIAKIQAIVYCSLSPFEQKAFGFSLRSRIVSMTRRVAEEFFYVVPPFALMAGIYKGVEDINARKTRKNPDDYLYDE